MKVLLVIPPAIERRRVYSLPSLGIAHIAAVLMARHEVMVLDYAVHGFSERRFARAVRSYQPDCVGFGCTSPMFAYAVGLARIVREAAPRAKIVFGGPHVTALPDASVAHGEIDCVVMGEGEYALAELCDVLDGGGSPAGVAGIAWKDDGAVRVNETRAPIADLDALPFPAWGLLDMPRYYSRFRPSASMITARGCPFACTFCASRLVHGTRVRRRSVEHVMEEIELLANRHGVRYLYFFDDTFTLDRDHTLALCERLASMRARLSYWCYTRSDCMDPELARALRRSGCESIGIGFESGSPEVLMAMNKRCTIEEGRAAAEAVRAAGIFLEGFFVANHPGETMADFGKTASFIRSLDLSFYDINFAVAYPGTALADRAGSHGCADWFTEATASRMSSEERKIAVEVRSLRRRVFTRASFYRLLWRTVRCGSYGAAFMRHAGRVLMTMVSRLARPSGSDARLRSDNTS